MSITSSGEPGTSIHLAGAVMALGVIAGCVKTIARPLARDRSGGAAGSVHPPQTDAHIGSSVAPMFVAHALCQEGSRRGFCRCREAAVKQSSPLTV